MYATRLLPIFTTPRIESLNHDERLPVLIVLGLFVCNELRVTGGRATLDHVDTHDYRPAAAGLQTPGLIAGGKLRSHAQGRAQFASR
jgi:hypothetical protein